MSALRIVIVVPLEMYMYETFKEVLKALSGLRNSGLMPYQREAFATEDLHPTGVETVSTETH
jgi:hypothetical protein